MPKEKGIPDILTEQELISKEYQRIKVYGEYRYIGYNGGEQPSFYVKGVKDKRDEYVRINMTKPNSLLSKTFN